MKEMLQVGCRVAVGVDLPLQCMEYVEYIDQRALLSSSVAD